MVFPKPTGRNGENCRHSDGRGVPRPAIPGVFGPALEAFEQNLDRRGATFPIEFQSSRKRGILTLAQCLDGRRLQRPSTGLHGGHAAIGMPAGEHFIDHARK